MLWQFESSLLLGFLKHLGLLIIGCLGRTIPTYNLGYPTYLAQQQDSAALALAQQDSAALAVAQHRSEPCGNLGFVAFQELGPCASLWDARFMSVLLTGFQGLLLTGLG